MIVLIILLIIIILLSFIGIYFVRFALLRKDEFNMKVMSEKEKELTPEKRERKRVIEANTAEFNSMTEKFMEKSPARSLHITSPDGVSLTAEFHEEEGHRYAILVHGYMGNRTQMRHLAAVYSSWGYSTLLPDNRAHGESEGKWIGMGWLDKDDILLWINTIVAQDSEAEIVLHGISMGAATVMMTAGLDLPANVRAAVEDCGYTSVWNIFKDELRAIYHLPAFPVLYSFDIFSRLLAGYSPRKASSLEMLKRSALPMLFIHGDDDHFVSTYMLDENYGACKGKKEKLLIHDAGHAEAYLREPELYFSTVRKFLESI